MTTTPNTEMTELHDRMPVILEQQDCPMWLGEVEGDYAALLHPAPNGVLRVWPVDRRVGSPDDNGVELLEHIAAYGHKPESRSGRSDGHFRLHHHATPQRAQDLQHFPGR